MKTREQIREEVAALKKNFILLSAPTGIGKTRTALDTTYKENTLIPPKVLIVYPKHTIKNSWLEDYKKWGYEDKLDGVTFTTYNSLDKHVNEMWDMILFDEGHHITERVMGIIEVMKYKRVMVLSATIKAALRYQLMALMPGLYVYKVTMKNAIDSEILPDPKIVLIPLSFNVKDKTETMVVRNSKTDLPVKVIPFEHRHFYKDKKYKYVVYCTEAQYIMALALDIEALKKKTTSGNPTMKNIWLHKAGERLKWLASKKTKYVREILEKVKDERTLTFCASIEQTENVGKNCIHSKNKLAQDVLDQFNKGKINHITACAMLDEGINLTNCRIGIFANINSSERLQIQRIGRVLRHAEPIIIIPYYKNSREEEIVNAMLMNYNPKLITTIDSIDNLSLQKK